MYENLTFAGTLITALGPLFLVFYFLFDSIIQANLKGIIYILGVIGTCIITILIGKTVSLKNYNEPDRSMCFPITIKNMVNILAVGLMGAISKAHSAQGDGCHIERIHHTDIVQ